VGGDGHGVGPAVRVYPVSVAAGRRWPRRLHLGVALAARGERAGERHHRPPPHAGSWLGHLVRAPYHAPRRRIPRARDAHGTVPTRTRAAARGSARTYSRLNRYSTLNSTSAKSGSEVSNSRAA